MNTKLSAGVLVRCTAVLVLLCLSYSASADKDIMLVLDNSGSMRKNDPTFLARGAVGSFIEQLGPSSSAGVLIFDQSVSIPVPLTPIDDASKARLIESLDGINYRGQLTDSPAAIERAIYELKTKGRADANKLIVFMTDGIVDTGNAEADIEKTKWLRDELAVDAKANGIRVFAIAFTENADFFLIQSLANKTDGEYYRAMEPTDLAGVFDKVYGALDTPTAPPKVVAATPEPIVEPEPIAAPEPVLVPEPAPAPETGPAVTPLPDSRLVTETLPATASAELLASLTEDERLALEDISAQTGIPIEQLATELVGAETDVEVPGRVESGTVIVTSPGEAPTADDERRGTMILVGAALLLLLLVILVVWFLRRRAKSGASTAGPTAIAVPAGEERAIPDAFLNDINHYTDDPAIQLGEKPLMVGRVAGTDTEHLDYLVVNKGTVGRRHAIIKYKDYSFWIVDQGSVNGTFVNAERTSGERQLKHGDRIRFHKYEFEFSQPEMDDGFHTVLAEPDAADATIVASAATMAATMALDAGASRPDKPAEEEDDEADALFGVEQDEADAAVEAEAPSAAFADSDVFDITGETAILAPDPAADPNDETLEDGNTAAFASSPAMDLPEADEADLPSTVITQPDDSQASAGPPEDGEDYDEDDEDLGVDINLDAIGADDHPSLILDNSPLQSPPQEDFEADASAFFEDLTVGPTPDDEAGPTPDPSGDDMFDMDAGGDEADEADEQAALDAKLERASALLDGDSDDDVAFGELETVARSNLPGPDEKTDDPNDMTLDQFVETDSFDAPETVPPVHPKTVAGDDPGDVTLDAFMSTSMFESGKVELTNEDETVVPDAVPDNPGDEDNPIAGDTVVLPGSPLAKSESGKDAADEDDDDDDDDSEDPTILR